MLHLQVFTDGSVNTQSKVGYGAYLALSDNLSLKQGASRASLKDTVRVKRFENTSSTKLELQTLIWAVNQTIALAGDGECRLTVYTDSQNIIGLPERRARLEKNNYLSSKNKLLNNHELYQDFYRLISSVKLELVKVVGHQPESKKGEIDRLFSCVDQASRRALREEL